ncbi:hypothetical protein FA002_24040 [Priestia megaterium]|uniref:hypothetical protein n=1 Tax=Priestia megaterium TaxID=1404 RepID=UPI0010AB6953|nr:hypothetical protein [Priestia megaterium]TJZ32249.1 hypothetical protein FA002_24040 [Priestia megaterium]
MKNFFRNPLKVSVSSLAATVILYVVIIGVPLSRAFTASTFGALIQITVPILIFITLLGFIYSFFIKGYQKFIFLLLHFISICIISFGIYVSIALRDFAP